MDKEDRYLRFFSTTSSFSHKKIQPMVNIDYSTNMILVGVFLEEERKQIIASSGYFKTNKPGTVELAIVVDEKWRRKGLSKILFQNLITIAREHNYKYIAGSILLQNRAMLHILNEARFPLVFKHIEGGVIEFLYDITKEL